MIGIKVPIDPPPEKYRKFKCPKCGAKYPDFTVDYCWRSNKLLQIYCRKCNLIDTVIKEKE